jgi:hypothetical protein
MRLTAIHPSAPALRVSALALAAFLLVAMLGRATMRRTAAVATVDRSEKVLAAPVYADPAPMPQLSERRLAVPPASASPSMPARTMASDASESAIQLVGTLSVAPPASDAATSMVIRTGTATIQVDSLEPGMTRVRAIAARLGGFIANASLAAGREQVRSATLELKVPAARYDDLVNALSPIGRVETVNVTAADVGEEYVDVGARVANARRLEERLVALLAKRTGKLTDVLEVEQQLARVREEIERYEGRMRWLKAHAAVSTLSLTVHEPPPVVGPSPAAEPIRDAFRQAWRNTVGLAAWVIAASGVYVPLAGLAVLVWYVIGPRRRRAVKRAAPAT